MSGRTNDRRSGVLRMGLVPILLTAALASSPAHGRKGGGETADDEAIAVVLDREITRSESGALRSIVFRALLERFAREKGIRVSEGEIDAFLAATEKLEARQIEEMRERRDELAAELKAPDLGDERRKKLESRLKTVESILSRLEEEPELTPEQQRRLRENERQSSAGYIRRWKINRELYREYGGRVIFQQAGPEPIDAYRAFLEECEARGSFEIHDERLENEFWRYFVDDEMHNFYPEGEGKEFMEMPWWEMNEPPEG